MRLVDADALLENKFEAIDYGDPIEVVEVSDIDDAPTIEAEPVRHGKWVYDILNMNLCTCCLESFSKKLTKKFIYCPSCGARMDKKNIK